MNSVLVVTTSVNVQAIAMRRSAVGAVVDIVVGAVVDIVVCAS
jgi:hypothetical protein